MKLIKNIYYTIELLKNIIYIQELGYLYILSALKYENKLKLITSLEYFLLNNGIERFYYNIQNFFEFRNNILTINFETELKDLNIKFRRSITEKGNAINLEKVDKQLNNNLNKILNSLELYEELNNKDLQIIRVENSFFIDYLVKKEDYKSINELDYIIYVDRLTID